MADSAQKRDGEGTIYSTQKIITMADKRRVGRPRTRPLEKTEPSRPVGAPRKPKAAKVVSVRVTITQGDLGVKFFDSPELLLQFLQSKIAEAPPAEAEQNEDKNGE